MFFLKNHTQNADELVPDLFLKMKVDPISESILCILLLLYVQVEEYQNILSKGADNLLLADI